MSFRLTKQIKRTADQRMSKMNSMINKTSNRENILKFSEETNLSENMAARYFDRQCSCGEKVNFEDVAMFLRYNGRYSELEQDDRVYMCSKCLAKHLGLTGQEYWVKIYENIHNGCSLF